MVLWKQFRRPPVCGLMAALWLLGGRAGAADGQGGAAESLSAERFGNAHGLANGHTRALAQTSDGYLWVGTTTGLWRFDGRQFEPITTGDFPALADHYIGGLATDSTGALWILHRQGVARMDAGGVKATAWRHEEPIDQMVAFGDGIAFTSGSNFFTANLERATNVTAAFPGAFDTSKAAGIASDGKRLLMASEDGKWAELTWGVAGMSHGSVAQHLGEYKLVAAGVSSGGTNLFGATYKLNGILVTVPPVGEPVKARFRPNSGRRNKIAQLASGEMAALSATGLDKLGVGEEEQIGRGLHDTVFNQPGEGVVDFMEDRQGALWLAGDYHGIYRVRRDTAVSRPGADHPSIQDGVRAVVALKDGSVLAGGHGLILANTQGGATAMPDGRHDKPPLAIRSLGYDQDGTLWIGAGAGLHVIRRGEVAVKIDLPGDPQGKIYAILSARDGAVWLGSPHGLHRLKDEGHWFSATAQKGFSADVRHVLEDRQGVVWAATRGGGIFYQEGDAWRTVTMKDGLLSDIIWHLHEDGEGDLWASGDAGVQVLRDGGPAMTFTSADGGLPFEEVHTVIEDDWGRIWMSSDVGIASALRRDFVRHHLGQLAEIPFRRITPSFAKLRFNTNGKFSSPGVAKTADGALWYAATDGLVRVDPRPEAARTSLPDVAFKAVKAGRETVHQALFPESVAARARALGGMAPSVAGPASWLGAVELVFHPGTAGSLEFHIAGIDLIHAERPAIQYRMRGFDKDWRDLGETGAAIYDNLKPRAYALEARARASDGHWGPGRELARITLKPFFYETHWFLGLCGLAAAGILGSIHAWRTSYLAKVHELGALRLKEEMRLKAEASLAQQRELIAKNIHDDAGAAMVLLQSALGAAKRDLGPALAGALGGVQQAADQFFTDIRHLMWHVSPKETTLDNLLLQIMSRGESVLQASGARLRRAVPELPNLQVAPVPRSSLYYACKEIFTNMARHSGASNGRIAATLEAGTLTLLIEDDGRGFPDQTAPPKPNPELAGGMGTGNIRERLRSLGGSAEQVAPETFPQGAAWRLTIPIASLSPQANATRD